MEVGCGTKAEDQGAKYSAMGRAVLPFLRYQPEAQSP
jgi:hypothetical protein